MNNRFQFTYLRILLILHAILHHGVFPEQAPGRNWFNNMLSPAWSPMYISILNWQFFPYFSWKWLNFHIRFVMPNVSVTNRVFKDIYYLFPYSPAHWMKNPPPRRREICSSILYLWLWLAWCRHGICQKIYTAAFSGQKFYSINFA